MMAYFINRRRSAERRARRDSDVTRAYSSGIAARPCSSARSYQLSDKYVTTVCYYFPLKRIKMFRLDFIYSCVTLRALHSLRASSRHGTSRSEQTRVVNRLLVRARRKIRGEACDGRVNYVRSAKSQKDDITASATPTPDLAAVK